MTPPVADPDEIARALAVLYEPGAVVELRVPQTRQGTLSGYFTDWKALIEAATRLRDVEGVYTTLNPVRPELLARAQNKLKPYAKHTTSDADIVIRRWILFDYDVRRLAGISSTDAEHEAALVASRVGRHWLCDELGFSPQSILLADSGNGAHVLVRIALENTLDATVLVRRCLEAAALYCNTTDVLIDPTVYNAARIVKLYGTVAAKGDATLERPHRLARLLEVPA
jgi:hypothetical protein